MHESQHPCRVCLAEGARNIFNTNTINDEMCTVASINHIPHKLQYVTQLQVNVNEDDGLPFWICELCIVQLNVAYRFKMLAGESDNFLRQRLKDTEPPSVICNPIALPEMEHIDVDQPEMKQEPSNEIYFGSVVVSNNDNKPSLALGISQEAANELGDSSGALDNIPGMVCLQKDLLNPAEDEAFLKDILKQKVIAIPWEIISDSASNSQQPTNSSAISPNHSIEQANSSKTPNQKAHTRKRKRSSTENKQTSVSKKVRSKPKQTTTGQQGAATETTSKLADNHGTPKENAKPPSKALLRKRRLQKVLESLRIDMVDDKLVDRCSLTQGTLQLPLPKIPMKRRNSICVSSFTQWL
uniref:ZAD domain-containing protein n=1 Tax=Anopheles christyi TaxID=43041 RepID=A0A182K0S7_9DIPT